MAEGGSSAREAFRPPKDDPDDKTEMIHYDVKEKPIGAGAFGSVYEALHRGSNTRMAMKKVAVGKRYWDNSEESTAVRKEREGHHCQQKRLETIASESLNGKNGYHS